MEIIIIITLIVIFSITAYFYDKQNVERLTTRGKLKRNEIKIIDGVEYLVQEFTFKTYNKAHAEYFKIVNEIEAEQYILDSKYDLYDWSFNYIAYQNATIGIQYYRSYNSVQIVKSKTAVDISTLENANPFFEYHLS